MATSTASISSSSAPPLLVIGAGSSVVTWDCRHDPSSNDDAIIQTFHPFGNNNTGEKIADLAWNHNGQVLACCSATSQSTGTTNTTITTDDKNVVLMSSQSGSILDSFRHTDITSDPTKQQPRQPKYSTSSFRKAQSTSVSFGGKSRYLCVGDNEGTTVLWDLKKQSRVRQFKAPNQTKSPAIIQACLDPTAAFMCSLSSQALSFYNLRQATFARQWTYPNTTATSGSQNSRKGGAAGAAAGGGGGGGGGGWCQLRFSPLQPTMLALGDTAGRIQLYNSVEHDQPQLVCGGGYSSSIASNSTPGSAQQQQQQQLLSHHASPITGLAFSTQNSKLLANVRANGILEFVDTCTGEVIHHQSTGNSSSATALAFQGVSCVVGNAAGEAQVYDLRKMMQQFGRAVTTYQMPSATPISTLEFSPLPKTTTTATTMHRRRTSGSGSSLSGTGVVGNAVSFDLESRASMTSYTEPPGVVPSDNDKNSNDNGQNGSSMAVASQDASTTHPPTDAAAAATTMTTTTASQIPISVREAASAAGTSRIATQPRTNTSRVFRNTTVSNSNNSNSNPTATSTNHGNNNNHNSANGDTLPSAEVTMYLQHMVRHELQDQMEVLQENVQESLQRLHVDMIRQFHRQSQELMGVVRQQQMQVDRLMQENEFLRDQNETLTRRSGVGFRQSGKNYGQEQDPLVSTTTTTSSTTADTIIGRSKNGTINQ